MMKFLLLVGILTLVFLGLHPLIASAQENGDGSEWLTSETSDAELEQFKQMLRHFNYNDSEHGNDWLYSKDQK